MIDFVDGGIEEEEAVEPFCGLDTEVGYSPNVKNVKYEACDEM